MTLIDRLKRERVQHADRAHAVLNELEAVVRKSRQGIENWEFGEPGLPEFDAATAAKAIDAVARYVVAAETHAAAVREQG